MKALSDAASYTLGAAPTDGSSVWSGQGWFDS
jgi:hypothetical protein